MCQRVQCEQCGKASWIGCGRHVDEVLRGVAEDERCRCPRPAAGRSWLSRLLGR